MKKYYNNADNGMIGGVCEGLGEHFGIDSFIIRIIFFLMPGVFFWPYIALWIFAPQKPREKL